MHERMNAGHASARSSLRHPGSWPQATSCREPVSFGGGFTQGDEGGAGVSEAVVSAPVLARGSTAPSSSTGSRAAESVPGLAAGAGDAGAVLVTFSASPVAPFEASCTGTAGGACRVGAAQEASTDIVAKTATVRHTFNFALIWLDAITKGYPMFWVFLELALGLALFVFLVWWTLPKKDKGDPPE